MVKVAINGFGRIGRNTLRAAIREGIFNEIDYVAINDPGLKPEDAARLFKYDSVMGRFDGSVEAYEEGIVVNGKKIKFFAEKDPAVLPWKDFGGVGVVGQPGLCATNEVVELFGLFVIWEFCAAGFCLYPILSINGVGIHYPVDVLLFHQEKHFSHL